MNGQDPGRILQLVLLTLPRGIWYVVNQDAAFTPTLQQATGLTHRQLESLLVTAQIIQQRAGQNAINSRGINNFQATFPLCTQLHIHRTRFNSGGRFYTFVCIGPPNQHSTPRTQDSEASRRVVSRHKRNNQLDPQLVAATSPVLTDEHMLNRLVFCTDAVAIGHNTAWLHEGEKWVWTIGNRTKYKILPYSRECSWRRRDHCPGSQRTNCGQL